MRRVTAAISVALLLLVAAAVAEGALLALVVLFVPILRMNTTIELGDRTVGIYEQLFVGFPTLTVHTAGTIASFLVTFCSGAGAAIYRYRRWRPAR